MAAAAFAPPGDKLQSGFSDAILFPSALLLRPSLQFEVSPRNERIDYRIGIKKWKANLNDNFSP